MKKRFVILLLQAILIIGWIPLSIPAEMKINRENSQNPSKISLSPTVAPQNQSEDLVFLETLEEKIPLIYSHDGAPDDIATLVYLSHHPMIELIGVIQSYGEQRPSQSLEEWQIFLYEVLDLDDVPIGLGSDESLDPLHSEFPQSWRDGADNFWGVPLPSASADYESGDGAQLIVELIENSPQKVSLLVTGAQTDLALALQQAPDIAANIAQIVIMGGAFKVDGNLNGAEGYEDNNAAEWNIFVDAQAAKQVFTSRIPLTVVSLDGSDNFVIRSQDYAMVEDSTDPAVSLLADLWEMQFTWWNGDFKIWDIVAGVALTNPELFTWEYGEFDVITDGSDRHGQTVLLEEDSTMSRFTADTNYEGVHEAILEILE